MSSTVRIYNLDENEPPQQLEDAVMFTSVVVDFLDGLISLIPSLHSVEKQIRELEDYILLLSKHRVLLISFFKEIEGVGDLTQVVEELVSKLEIVNFPDTLIDQFEALLDMFLSLQEEEEENDNYPIVRLLFDTTCCFSLELLRLIAGSSIFDALPDSVLSSVPQIKFDPRSEYSSVIPQKLLDDIRDNPSDNFFFYSEVAVPVMLNANIITSTVTFESCTSEPLAVFNCFTDSVEVVGSLTVLFVEGFICDPLHNDFFIPVKSFLSMLNDVNSQGFYLDEGDSFWYDSKLNIVPITLEDLIQIGGSL